MRFLITIPVPGWVSHPLDDPFISYLPEGAASGILPGHFSAAACPDLWLANGDEVTADLLSAWRQFLPTGALHLMVQEADHRAQLTPLAAALQIAVHPFPPKAEDDAAWIERLLRAAEGHYTDGLAQSGLKVIHNATKNARNQQVVLVGAGIVNLVTAEYLAARGYAVRVIDGCPDPRSCQDWRQLGVTFGGGNARMYTRTEADNYNEKGSEIYQDMRAIFRTPVLDGGWCVKHPDTFTPAEENWVSTFESTPPWLARIFSEHIFEINCQSGLLWEDWMARVPSLFEDVTLRPDILRMYVEPHAVEAARTLHHSLRAMVQDDSPESFLASFPIFDAAAKTGDFVGGFRVQGFTLNIHPFMRRLINRIESMGGTFQWDCRIHEILRDGSGKVRGLQGDRGEVVADHYILSPGVGGNAMLKGTLAENLLQGTLGVWLQIPNLAPKLQHSIKIHRRGHLVEDINVTVAVDEATGEDILVFGGGYGFAGLERPDPDSADLNALFAELETVARIYFPEAYAHAKANGGLFPRGERRFCVRPFTPTGLGVFEVLPTTGAGQLIITGGHNTGGFAQSPAIAQAVWRALNGIADPMHVWFHPARSGRNMPQRRNILVQPS